MNEELRMREIKFRAKGVDGKWWYGSARPDTVHFRNVNLATFFANLHVGAILPDTLCEYTGLKDKNGVEIYEGDIINQLDCAVVTYIVDTFWAVTPRGSRSHLDSETDKVIGNIYENPELVRNEG